MNITRLTHEDEKFHRDLLKYNYYVSHWHANIILQTQNHMVALSRQQKRKTQRTQKIENNAEK